MEYYTRRHINRLLTITIDTPRRGKTVIRKNDIARAGEIKPLPPPEQKPRLIHVVACKTVGNYKRNKEKIRKFCLEEHNAAKREATTASMPGPSSSKCTTTMQTTPNESKPKQKKQASTRPKATVETKWSKDKLVKLATQKQRRRQQQKSRPIETQSGTKKKKSRQSTPKSSFNYKAQQAALLESANISPVKPG